MDNYRYQQWLGWGRSLIGALFAVTVLWLATPTPVQAYASFSTKTCTAAYAGQWGTKGVNGEFIPWTDASLYDTNCAPEGKSGIKPWVSMSEPNDDIPYGGTLMVRGMAVYNICFNTSSSYKVHVEVYDKTAGRVLGTGDDPPVPIVWTQQSLNEAYYNSVPPKISYWDYIQESQKLQLQQQRRGRGGEVFVGLGGQFTQQQGLSEGQGFNVGPFSSLSPTHEYTIKITTSITAWEGSTFTHYGEMSVKVLEPSPWVPTMTPEGGQWEVGDNRSISVSSTAYRGASTMALEIKDDSTNPQSQFAGSITSGNLSVSPNDLYKETVFTYRPTSAGVKVLQARACNIFAGSNYCSGWSSPYYARVLERQVPGAPGNVKAYGGDKKVFLTWDAPTTGAAASRYRVYRSLSPGSLPEATLNTIEAAGATRVCDNSPTTPCLAGETTTLPTIQDPLVDIPLNNGTTYYYVVRAKAEQYSAPSQEAHATPAVTSAKFDLNVTVDPTTITKGVYSDKLNVSAIGTAGDIEIPVDLIVTKRQPENPNVYGWAWGGGIAKDGSQSDTLGWISMNCTNEGTCETGSATTGGGKNYGLKIEDYTDAQYKGKRAKLSGFAWAGGKEKKPDVDNPTSPNDYQDTNADDPMNPKGGGWICFGESCPGTTPGVAQAAKQGNDETENAGPSDAWIDIDKNSSPWGTVHGWAKVLNLGDDGWIQLGGRSKDSSTNTFKEFPLRLSKDSDVSHKDVAGKSYRTFGGHAWGNGRVAPGNAQEQDCESNQQCLNPVGWIDFSCENNSFGVSCTDLHNLPIPGVNDKSTPTANKASYPSCSNNFKDQPYADCFEVGTDYVPPFANLLASDLNIVNVDDPTHSVPFEIITVPTGRKVLRHNADGTTTQTDVDVVENVINIIQDQKIQFIARVTNAGGGALLGKNWDNGFYDLPIDGRISADRSDGNVPIKTVRTATDTAWNPGDIKEIATDKNAPFVFPSTVVGCARGVYTCRHYIWFKTDTSNEIPEELSKTDNVIGPIIVNIISSKPDLEIVDMIPLADPLPSLPPTTALGADLAPLASQYYSDTFTMLVGIKNTGLKPATMAGLPLAIYARPALPVNATPGPKATNVLKPDTTPLAVGETYYTQITIPTKNIGSPGDYVLTGYVDNTNVLSEMNDDNNQSNTCGRGSTAITPCVFTVAIDPPDLTIPSMSVSKTKVKPGDTFTITATVKNKGDSALTSANSNANVRTELYMLPKGPIVPLPIKRSDFGGSEQQGLFTTAFRDLAAGAEIPVQIDYTFPTTPVTAPGFYTFCAYVDIAGPDPYGAVYEGRLGGELNNGSGSFNFTAADGTRLATPRSTSNCVDVEVQSPPPKAICQSSYEGNRQALVTWSLPPTGGNLSQVKGWTVQRWIASSPAATNYDAEFGRTGTPLAPGYNPGRTSYRDSDGTLSCGVSYNYRVVSINDVGETASDFCNPGVVQCTSKAYLEYNIKSSFPADLSIRLGRAVHKPDPNGQPTLDAQGRVVHDAQGRIVTEDVLPDIDHYEDLTLPGSTVTKAIGCKYLGDTTVSGSIAAECKDKFTPGWTASSAHTVGGYSTSGANSRIDLAEFFGNLPPSFPTNQMYMKVRDNHPQVAVDTLLPPGTPPPSGPPAPPTPAVSSTVVDPHGYEPSSMKVTADNRPIAVYQGDLGQLTLGVCGDAVCSYKILVDIEKWGTQPSLQLYNDLPVIAWIRGGQEYWDGSHRDAQVMFTFCNDNHPCTDPVTTVALGDENAYRPSLQMNGAKMVIAYSAAYKIGTTSNWGSKVKLIVCDKSTDGKSVTCSAPKVIGEGTEPSLQILNGNPVIAYNNDFNLKLARCSDTTCTAAPTVTTIEAKSADGGQEPSLLLQAGGIPAVAYTTYQNANKIKLARCTDAACSSSTKLVVNADGGSASLAATSNGLALTYVAREWPTKGTVRLARCSTSSCTSQVLGPFSGYFGSTSLVVKGEIAFAAYDSGGLKISRVEPLNPTNQKINISWGPLYALEVSPEGTPSIVLGKDTTDKNIINCTTPSCQSPAITKMSLVPPASMGGTVGPTPEWRGISLQTTKGGQWFSYYVGGQIGVARCVSRPCLRIYTKDNIAPGWQTSLQLNNGLPVVAFIANDGSLKLLLCGTPVAGTDPCQNPVVKQLDAGVSNPSHIGGVTLKLNNGLPVIGFASGASPQIKLILCDDAACSTHTTKLIDTVGSSRPDIALNAGKPVLAYVNAHKLKIAFCSDSSCSAITYKDGPAADIPYSAENNRQYDVGYAPSIQLLSDQSPMIAFVGPGYSQNPMLAWCANATNCGTIATRTISTTQTVLSKVIVRLINGQPIVVYDILQNDDNYLGIASGLFSGTPQPWVGSDRPRANEEYASDNPTFSWVYDQQGRANPENGWRIQVSTDAGFTTTVIDSTCTKSATKTCADTSFRQALGTARAKGEFSIAAATSSALHPGTRYCWRVMVQDTLGTLGAGTWSSPQCFSIAATPPGDQHEILSAKIVKVGSSEPYTYGYANAGDPPITKAEIDSKKIDPANNNTIKFVDLGDGYVYFGGYNDDHKIETKIDPNDYTNGEITIKPGKPAKIIHLNVSTVAPTRPPARGRHVSVMLAGQIPGGMKRKLHIANDTGVPDNKKHNHDKPPYNGHNDGHHDSNNNGNDNDTVSFDLTRGTPSIAGLEIEIEADRTTSPGHYDMTIQASTDNPGDQITVPVYVVPLLPSALCVKPLSPKASTGRSTTGCILTRTTASDALCNAPNDPNPQWGTRVDCFLGTVQLGKSNQSLNHSASGPATTAQRIGLMNPGGKDVDFTLRGRGSQGTGQGTNTKFQLYKANPPESSNSEAVNFGSFSGLATAQDPQFDMSIPPHVPALDPSTGSYPLQTFEVVPVSSSDAVNSAQVTYEYFVNRAPIATPLYPILGDTSRMERKRVSANPTGYSTNLDDCENVAGLHDYHKIYNVKFGYDACNKDDKAYDASSPLRPKLSWKFVDRDAITPSGGADKQTKYQLEVQDLNGISKWTSGVIATDGPTAGSTADTMEVPYPCDGTNSAANCTALTWNTSYQWHVKVWDNNGGDSGDLASAPWFKFVTPRHPDPIANFTYSPKIVLANTEIHFTNNSLCYDDGLAANQTPTACPDPKFSTPVPPAKPQLIKPGATYFWIFGKPDDTKTPAQFNDDQKSTDKNPTYQFLEGGDQSITLTVIDQAGYTSSPSTATLGDPNATPSTVPHVDCKALPNWCNVSRDAKVDPATTTNPSCKEECIDVQTIEFKRRAP